MTANFDFLKGKEEYSLFSPAAMEAEHVFATSPAMAAVACRKALELAVKWVYSADNTIVMPYKDNLQALIHEPSFRFALDSKTWGKLPYIIKLGNLAVHTEKTISKSDAMLSLAGLFEFIEWIDYCYGQAYQERQFDETLIPLEQVKVDEQKLQESEQFLAEKEFQIKELLEKIEQMSGQYTAQKDQHQQERTFTADDISEYETRKKNIDVDLKLLGWTFGEEIKEEVEVKGMPNSQELGYVDYVLYGNDKLPLAIVEAKRTSKDPKVGLHQAKLYADCLENQTGRRPIIFATNGFETYIWDDMNSPQRKVSSIFSKSDLEKLVNRRTGHKNLNSIEIQDNITDRYYQKEAIRAVCHNIETGHRKSLLVMATGTGKTRTASSLTDVLSRAGYITNILFLADRTALVTQAKDDFKNYLPDMSLCNLLTNKDDKNARIVFSTYPTMLNAIDTAKTEEGKCLFTPAHFDLIIIDEAHRSIFKKYRAIFEYFDSYLVGLTATPKTEVDRNTYDFFEMESGVPTYAYDYDTAVEKDKVLVPYHNIEVKTKFLDEGITYDDLSDEDKKRYEEDFTDEDGNMPEYVAPPEINQFIFNQDTVDYVLEYLMEKGHKVAGGDRIGKTIIFAANKRHADFIVERFNKLYPQYHGEYAKRIVCDDSYAQTLITDFKMPDKAPHIAVSVDMLDTGIDVPEIVNLVFFKKVRSKTKFWQMIGRGTRLCKDLFGPDQHKQNFYIFDYLSNFEFFRQNPQGIDSSEGKSLTEMLFEKKIKLIFHLQQSAFIEEKYQSFRTGLIDDVVTQINALNPEQFTVRMNREYVEQYSTKEAFTCLSEMDKTNLISYIAPLVYLDETDEYAKRFDNLMYGLMISQIEGLPQFAKGKHQLVNIGVNLSKKMTIPQVKQQIEIINTIQADEFWKNTDILSFELVRTALRELIKFIIETDTKQTVYTNLSDIIVDIKEGEPINVPDTFEDYKLKVNRYVEQHKDHVAIFKLRNNIPLTELDYEDLEGVLTGELGSKNDYKREFGDTPFGLLIRKIAKLERDAAMKVFSEFINDQSLNQNQIVFVRKVIDYVVENGYIENISELRKPPFDKPQSLFSLFDQNKQKRIMELVDEVKTNAVKIV